MVLAQTTVNKIFKNVIKFIFYN